MNNRSTDRICVRYAIHMWNVGCTSVAEKVLCVSYGLNAAIVISHVSSVLLVAGYSYHSAVLLT